MGRKNDVDISKKPGYEAYDKSDRRWMRDLVSIRIMDNASDGEPAVVCVGINGTHYNIPRGVNVKVPKIVSDKLEKDIFQHHWAMPGRQPLQGLQYMGKQPRFYVIPLAGEPAESAVEVKPAAPIAAEQRLEFGKQMIEAAKEDATAREQIRSAPVHDDLR